MKSNSGRIMGWAAAFALGCGMASTATAEAPDIGKMEFRAKCVVCHGESGKGDGSVLDLLKVAPANLTVLSKNNGGVFPFERVYSVIDGREAIKAHGDRDMPIWGGRYKTENTAAAAYYMDVPYDMEMYARARILALIDYLNRIQEK